MFPERHLPRERFARLVPVSTKVDASWTFHSRKSTNPDGDPLPLFSFRFIPKLTGNYDAPSGSLCHSRRARSPGRCADGHRRPSDCRILDRRRRKLAESRARPYGPGPVDRGRDEPSQRIRVASRHGRRLEGQHQHSSHHPRLPNRIARTGRRGYWTAPAWASPREPARGVLVAMGFTASAPRRSRLRRGGRGSPRPPRAGHCRTRRRPAPVARRGPCPGR